MQSMQDLHINYFLSISRSRLNEARLREMLRKNSRHESLENIINEAVAMFYVSEKKRFLDISFSVLGRYGFDCLFI